MTACLGHYFLCDLLRNYLLMSDYTGLVLGLLLVLVKSARDLVLVAVVLASMSQPDV